MGKHWYVQATRVALNNVATSHSWNCIVACTPLGSSGFVLIAACALADSQLSMQLMSISANLADLLTHGSRIISMVEKLHE
jgi:hypothetical protein